MSSSEDKVVVHKVFKMGRAPYKLVGIWSAPSKALQAANPSAYNIQMETRPKCCRFICDHCGTGIVHHFILSDADKNKFCVGSSCIDKLGQHELVTQAKQLELKRQQQIRQEKAEAKREAKRLQVESELEEQRKANGGLTDFELREKQRKEYEENMRDQFFDITRPIQKMLKTAGGDFCRSIANGMKEGKMPSGGGKTITIEIMTKQHSGARKNSKAYNESYAEMEELYRSVAEQLEKIRADYREFLHTSHGYKNR